MTTDRDKLSLKSRDDVNPDWRVWQRLLMKFPFGEQAGHPAKFRSQGALSHRKKDYILK
jgi:hypothetical protein